MWTWLVAVFCAAILPVLVFGLIVWWCYPCPWCRPNGRYIPLDSRRPNGKCTICNGWQISLQYGRRYK